MPSGARLTRRRRWGWILAIAVLAGAAPLAVPAQEGTATEGALFLLLPTGARAVGMGLAAMTARGTSESAWWNPAGLAGNPQREAAIHHSQSLNGTGDALNVVLPWRDFGVLALTASVLDLGEQEPRIDSSGALGTLLPRQVVFAASFATQLGRDAVAGVTYKVVQFRLDCTGACVSLHASTGALDVGAQYSVGSRSPVTIGAAVRNLGIQLQVNDAEQSDELPTRIEAGIEYRPPLPARYADQVAVRVALDLSDDLSLGSPRARIGSEIGIQRRAFLRAGYIAREQASEGGGPTVGLGFVLRRFVIDIGRITAGLSADAGQAPTHLSVRFLF
ncbi:MAG TPA: PorV/PorQ family protein [Gemmatimonadaceae bacterium]|nr:PorV/PorQ family protein [Gemmatimonadaceae bacterium]